MQQKATIMVHLDLFVDRQTKYRDKTKPKHDVALISDKPVEKYYQTYVLGLDGLATTKPVDVIFKNQSSLFANEGSLHNLIMIPKITPLSLERGQSN